MLINLDLTIAKHNLSAYPNLLESKWVAQFPSMLWFIQNRFNNDEIKTGLKTMLSFSNCTSIKQFIDAYKPTIANLINDVN